MAKLTEWNCQTKSHKGGRYVEGPKADVLCYFRCLQQCDARPKFEVRRPSVTVAIYRCGTDHQCGNREGMPVSLRSISSLPCGLFPNPHLVQQCRLSISVSFQQIAGGHQSAFWNDVAGPEGQPCRGVNWRKPAFASPKKAKFPKYGAVSTGRCNTGLEFTRGSLKAQSFSRALI